MSINPIKLTPENRLTEMVAKHERVLNELKGGDSLGGGGGTSDHGSLSGLGDDDHAQYHTDARALTWLGTRSLADLGTRSAADLSSGTLPDARLSANVATLTGAQTLTNKTLTSPSISSPTGLVKADVGLDNVTNDAQLKAASNLSDLADVDTSRVNIELPTNVTKTSVTGTNVNYTFASFVNTLDPTATEGGVITNMESTLETTGSQNFSGNFFTGMTGALFRARHNGTGSQNAATGLSVQAQNLTSGTLGTAQGGQFIGQSAGSGAVTTAVGGTFGAQKTSTGSVTDAISGRFSVRNSSATGTITNAYHLQIQDLFNTGTITNTYGLYIGDLTAGTQTNAPFAIYSSDSGANVAIAGKTRLGGTTAPTVALDVTGAALISSTLGVTGRLTVSDDVYLGAGKLVRLQGSTSGTLDLKAPATVTSYVLTLPDNDGASGQFLKTDGSGTTSWDSPAGGGDMAAATYDPAGIEEQLVGLTASQTLTNKTLDGDDNTFQDIPVTAIKDGYQLLGYASRGTNAATGSTTAVQITDATATVNIDSTSDVIRVSLAAAALTNTSTAVGIIELWRGTVGSGVKIGQFNSGTGSASRNIGVSFFGMDSGVSGSQTYNASIRTTAGTETMSANIYFLVEKLA